jgi:hypothetical protein
MWRCFVFYITLNPVIIEADNSRTVTKVSHSSTTETLALHLGRDRGRK